MNDLMAKLQDIQAKCVSAPFKDFPYGGHNDKALCFVQMARLDEAFCLRAHRDSGLIEVNLNCNDIFAWATSDAEPLPPHLWDEFLDSLGTLWTKVRCVKFA